MLSNYNNKIINNNLFHMECASILLSDETAPSLLLDNGDVLSPSASQGYQVGRHRANSLFFGRL